jgi:hypothetical protein
LVLLALHAYTFYIYGGDIQKIVTSKVNTRDIRSASLIDLQSGIVLLVSKEWSNMPMSTTWVFLGVLAGREIELASKLKVRGGAATGRIIGGDLAKAFSGLCVSVALVIGLPQLGTRVGDDERMIPSVRAAQTVITKQHASTAESKQGLSPGIYP